ncbi:unnamed protein product [Urochloa humidicola]
MAAALPTTARKRPAPDEACCSGAGKKKKRTWYEFDDINNYEWIEVIEEDEMGVLAKARDRRTGEIVAVKCIRGRLKSDKDLHHAVMREARCLEACRGHPGIVQIKTVAAEEDTGELYIVMEHVAGAETLHDRLATRGPFSEDETREAMRQLLGAVEKLQATGTMHREINPDNIFVAADGELKLCGFGCAAPANRERSLKPVGTLRYCAPEQLFRFRGYGTELDLWALGCVMAELLDGQPMFTSVTKKRMKQETIVVRDDIVSMGVKAFDDNLSVAGREVLAGLLAFHSDERLTAAEALQHRWFTGEEEEEMAFEHRWFTEEEDDDAADDEEAYSPAALELELAHFDPSFAAAAA